MSAPICTPSPRKEACIDLQADLTLSVAHEASSPRVERNIMILAVDLSAAGIRIPCLLRLWHRSHIVRRREPGWGRGAENSVPKYQDFHKDEKNVISAPNGALSAGKILNPNNLT